MSMEQAQLWSLNALAAEIAIDRRTLAKRLRGVTPDGKRHGKPAWKMRTALRALERAQGKRDGPGGNAAEAVITAVERAAVNVEAFLAKLRNERVVERRRAIAQAEGHVVGKLDRLLEQSIVAQGVDAVPTLSPFRNHVTASAIAELLRLCDWKIAA
jgi:hypothetical protein